MKFNKLFCKFKKEQNGAVIVMVALFMTVLMGMSALVIDLGFAYNSKSELQKDLDSVALAAVRELPASNTSDPKWVKALEVAEYYAIKNNIEKIDDLTYEPKIKNSKIVGIKVVGNADVEYSFAQIFGVNSGSVKCDATAELLMAEGISGFLPFVLDKNSIDNIKNSTTSVIIKYSDNRNPGNGWFGAVRMDGPGAKDYVTAIKEGSTSVINIDDILEKENGDMVGPTITGYNDRITNTVHKSCTFLNHEANCPRLAMIPIVETTYDAQGKVSYFTVKGFATIFLENIVEEKSQYADETKETKKSLITVRYVNTIVAPGTSVSGTVLNDYGVLAAKLVD